MRVDRETVAKARKDLEGVLQTEYQFSPPVEREMRKKRAYPISDATEVCREMDKDLASLLASDNERDRLLAQMCRGSSQAAVHDAHRNCRDSVLACLESFLASTRLCDLASPQGRFAWLWMGTLHYSFALQCLCSCNSNELSSISADIDSALAPAIEEAKHSRPLLELVHSHLQNLEVPRARLVPPIVIAATRPAKERVDNLIRLLRLCHLRCHTLTALHRDMCNDTDSTLLWVALSSFAVKDFRELRSLVAALYLVERPQEAAEEDPEGYLDKDELAATTEDFARSMNGFWNMLPAAKTERIVQDLETIRQKTLYWEWFAGLPAIRPLKSNQ